MWHGSPPSDIVPSSRQTVLCATCLTCNYGNRTCSADERLRSNSTADEIVLSCPTSVLAQIVCTSCLPSCGTTGSTRRREGLLWARWPRMTKCVWQEVRAVTLAGKLRSGNDHAVRERRKLRILMFEPSVHVSERQKGRRC
jgi:hypothetical protein